MTGVGSTDPLTRASVQPGDSSGPAHRPLEFADFIGQKSILNNLQVMIKAAQLREEPLEHVLFSGPPGLGKTTLAHIIAAEMSARVVVSSGPLLDRPGDLVAILSNLAQGQVFFIDEIHRIPKGVEETLYSAMEDFRVDIVVGTGPGARTISMPLERFTLIGATTRSGLLTAPLRDRFGVMFQMEFYTPDELQMIITAAASRGDFAIDEDAALHLAEHSRGTPRVALRLQRRIRDYAQVKGDGRIDLDNCRVGLEQLGIGALGLDRLDRAILQAIIERFGGGPVGLDTIAAVFHEERDVLSEVHEPYLLKMGLLYKTPRGRIATLKAYEYLGLPQPENAPGGPLFD